MSLFHGSHTVPSPPVPTSPINNYKCFLQFENRQTTHINDCHSVPIDSDCDIFTNYVSLSNIKTQIWRDRNISIKFRDIYFETKSDIFTFRRCENCESIQILNAPWAEINVTYMNSNNKGDLSLLLYNGLIIHKEWDHFSTEYPTPFEIEPNDVFYKTYINNLSSPTT